MKKFMLALLPVFVLLGITGCKKNSDEKITLQLFHYKQEIVNEINEIGQAFSQKYPNIVIETETIPNDAQTVLKSRLVAGNAPDIMMLQSYSTVFEYAEAGYSLDLSNEPFMQKIVDGAKNAVTYADKLYALPFDMAAIGIVYNKDLFTQLNLEIPTTYEELQNVAKVISENGYTPFSVSIKDNWPLGHLYSMAHTASIGDELKAWIVDMNNGTGTFSSEKMTKMFEVLDFYKANGGDKAIEMDYNSQLTNFSNGNYAMMIQGLWAYGACMKLNPELNVGFFPFPFTNDSTETKLYADTDSTFAISANAPEENIEAVKKFFDFLTSDEGAKLVVDKCKLVPTVNNADVSTMDAPFQDMIKYISEGKTMPWAFSMWPTVVFESSKPALQEYYSEQKTSDELMTSLDDLWKSAKGK